MSFGKQEMHRVCDELAPTTLVCEHRSNEWIVITQGGAIHYGSASPRGPGSRFLAKNLAEMSDHYRAWAKKLLKRIEHEK